jgi:predicted adenylyl cyclase CyaB
MSTGGEPPRANVEIKARCADLEAARVCAVRIATKHVGVDRQVDTYFRTSEGRLKLRESSLSGGQLVPYLRSDASAPRRSDYRVIPVADPEGLKRLLARILGVHRVVEKEREIFLVGNVRIHLDRVAGLGTFLELEAVLDGESASEQAEIAKVRRLMAELGVREEDLIAESYEGLLGSLPLGVSNIPPDPASHERDAT